MKKNYLSILFLLLANFVFAQNGQNDLSNIESFINQPEKYITYDYTEVGRVKNFNVQIISATNHTDNKKMTGLLISYENSTWIQLKGFVDDDEINGLIKTLEELKANVILKAPISSNSSGYYSGHAGFRIGLATISASDKNIWTPYIAFGGMDKDRKINMPVTDFDELVKLLAAAKTKLGIN